MMLRQVIRQSPTRLTSYLFRKGHTPVAETTVTILDETVGLAHERYTLDRLLKIVTQKTGTHKVRIRIQRDAFPHQSHARAEIFNAESTWTHVLDSPPSNWRDNTPHRPTGPQAHDIVRGVLDSVADDLTNRITAFLEA